MARVGPDDYVLIQFGHNDGGPVFTDKERGSLPGTGPEAKVETLASTGRPDTVHTYGWYLTHYVRTARTRGATPIICSPVPRNRWVDGKAERMKPGYAGWAEEVARSENVPFIDLNEKVAAVYDTLGEAWLWEHYFKDDHTHTTCRGAERNARMVAEGISAMRQFPVARQVKIPD